MQTQTVDAMVFGVDTAVFELVASVFGADKVSRFSSYDELATLLEGAPTAADAVFICGSRMPEIDPNELAQSLRITFLNSVVYFAETERTHYDRAKLRKNGFMEAFLLPLDKDRIEKTLQEARARTTSARLFRPICLVDLQPGEKLDFDTFLHLPFNNKFLRYACAGDEIDADRLVRLRGKEVKSLHVAHTDVGRVYAHAAARLRKLLPNVPSPIGETERRERLTGAVRDLVTDMFNASTQSATVENGKVLRSSAQEICKQLVIGEGPDQTWYDKLSRVAVESGDDYTHFTAVATYATLFSIGMRIGNPDEIALAGLLHDVGLADLAPGVAEKAQGTRTPKEEEAYRQHPASSLKLIKERKLILPTSVHEIILQHHERWDGNGFPEKLTEQRMSPSALVLALADQLDEMIRVRDGKKRTSPQAILLQFRAEGRFPPKFINQAIELLTG